MCSLLTLRDWQDMHSVWHSSREEAFISDAAVNCWGHALMYKYLRGVTPVTVSVVYPSETHRTESDLAGEVVLEIYMLTYTTTSPGGSRASL